MPARGKLTVWGLYEYDPTLFEGMELPEGVDADITRHRILLETGQLEVIYPDPEFLKEAIEWWSKANVARWGRLYATENLEYNPIWNVDGTETETTVRGLDETETENRSREEDNTQVVIEDNSQTREQDNSQSSQRDISVQNNGTNSMQGFNSTNMVGITGSADSSTTNDDETVTQDNSETISQDNTARTTQDNNASESVSRERGQDENTTVTRRRTGNIGVTSTQKLITEQRELQSFSIYKLLANEFKQEFCLLVY